MKFKYLFFLAILFSSILYAQDVNTDSPSSSQSKKILKGLIIGIRGGVKLPEERIGTGPWGGLYFNMPTGKGWSLQLEYNIWVAERDLREDLYTPEWTMLVAYKWNIKSIYIRMLGGIGGISSSDSWFGNKRDFLFSFNIALNVGFNFSQHISGFLQLRHQRAAEFSLGHGGIAFIPWLLGMGFEFDF
ncbi:MAG: hypothetical protein IIB08_06200 [Bacteroidetes bacterium]|nr:hypothetical protein [Bacteroidota bacterium]